VSADDARLALLRARVREVPDFPKPGILFRDLTPLMGDAAALGACVALLGERVAAHRPDVIVAVESRGFIFGAPVAAAFVVELELLTGRARLPGVRVDALLAY
jgi:adenine phosphoribosyltransferase